MGLFKNIVKRAKIRDIERIVEDAVLKEFKKTTNIKASHPQLVYLQLPLKYPDNQPIMLYFIHKKDSYGVVRDDNALYFYLKDNGLSIKDDFVKKCAKRAMSQYNFKKIRSRSFKEGYFFEKRIDLKSNLGKQIIDFATGLQQIAYSTYKSIIR